jgi:hypothetical protein
MRESISTTDESDNLPDPLSERLKEMGWRVISNPTLRPESEEDELKTLIQNMQKGHRTRGRRKDEETAPPDAA